MEPNKDQEVVDCVEEFRTGGSTTMGPNATTLDMITKIPSITGS